MRIQKAVITAAAPDQQALPLQRIVDRGGNEKSALQLIAEEVRASGIEEICVVIRPGDASAYRQAAGEHLGELTFLEQQDGYGYGGAILRAREFTAGDPFLHLVGDHLYLSHADRCCTRQLLDAAESEGCSISAVQPTRENKLPFFGAVGGIHVPRRQDLYKINEVLEKPTPTQAEQSLIVAGLRSGYYLCFFGMHVLTASVMEILGELQSALHDPEPLHLATALSILSHRERYLALEVEGSRFDIGVKYGLLMAQLALALAGEDRDQVLTELVELLAKK